MWLGRSGVGAGALHHRGGFFQQGRKRQLPCDLVIHGDRRRIYGRVPTNLNVESNGGKWKLPRRGRGATGIFAEGLLGNNHQHRHRTLPPPNPPFFLAADGSTYSRLYIWMQDGCLSRNRCQGGVFRASTRRKCVIPGLISILYRERSHEFYMVWFRR